MTRKYKPVQKLLDLLSEKDSKESQSKWWLYLFLLVLIIAGYSTIHAPGLLEEIDFSRGVYSDNGSLLHLTLSDDEKYRLYTPLTYISEELKEATLLYEDKYFYYHPGVNPVALIKAFWKTFIVKSRQIGASTITMQLARIRYKMNTRSVWGKSLQILRAIQIELLYSKDQILEAYLNLAPYGGNIEGVGAASLIYFNLDATQVKLPEAITLSVIPQNPKILFPEKNQSESNALNLARLKLLNIWKKNHPETVDQNEILAGMPIITANRRQLPFIAPHLVNYLLLNDHTNRHKIHSSLDTESQILIEKKITQYVNRKKSSGLRNAAAMLVDFRSMEVKAVVGSANFFNDSIEGQVNGTAAKRSPGSTLKPFIYALALDQGIIHPTTMLKDAPHSFSGYNPENYDSEFTGPIKATEALTKSRNIPAIMLAKKIKNPNLYGLLTKAGVTGLQKESYYGLAIVLGGLELTMAELVKLYAMIANGGLHQELVYEQTNQPGPGKQILSKEASYLTVKMLEKNTPPDKSFNRKWLRNNVPVAWKTGTSYAFRDGWAIGIFNPYVLAVWVGNFDGTPNHVFTGRQGAGPLFFQIFEALKYEKKLIQSDIDFVPNVKEIKVCSVSGKLPNKHCPQMLKTLFIPGKSPITKCDIHREILIDKDTGLRSCSDKGARKEVYEFWPSDLLEIFHLAGISRREPPPYDPSCSVTERAWSGNPPVITSPQNNVTYNLRIGEPDNRTIPFCAVTDADITELFWFVNKKYIGKSTSHKPLLWKASPGNFIIRVVDNHGRSDIEELEVSFVE